MKKSIASFVFIAASIFCFAGDEQTFKVISVLDGNTIEILTSDGERTKVLLHGIDSPEEGQSYSAEARQLLESLLLNKMITLVDRGKDRHGNRMVEVNANGIPDPQREMLRLGLAWTTHPDEELESIKEHARKLGMGLWTEENPTPPWLYRRQQSMKTPKAG